MKRFEYKDPDIRAMLERDHETIRLTGTASILETNIKDSHYNDENLVYNKVQEELSRVIGGRQARVEDRKYLPYTDAVIHETQRLANIVPMAVLHRTSQDVTFQGYFIKEGTCVLPLLTSVLQDESEWETPHTFNPSHFLDKEGTFIRRDAFMPFSAGRRMCPGEGLARMELFLFFTSLLLRFRFTPPPGVTEDELDLTPVVGFILTPSPHELRAVSRQ
ncbi:Cytochrome P450 2K1 [Dissostichus eleginoides]|nr:Cytochrome P450 2K1 [Dissostichus eleginoides]